MSTSPAIQFHNPERVSLSRIPSGWRFMAPEEVDGRHSGKCQVWLEKSDCFQAGNIVGDRQNRTYIVPSSIPLPGAFIAPVATPTLPPKDCPVCGAENAFAAHLYNTTEWEHYKCGTSYHKLNGIYRQKCTAPVAPSTPAERPFIDWHGGDCPVAKGTKVDVRLEDADIVANIEAGNCFWDERTRIVGWRLSEPETPPSVEPAPGEWIEWKGGKCPVDGTTVVECRRRDGCTIQAAARLWRWSHIEESTDVVAYRVLSPAKAEADPYADLKAAHARGEVIQCRFKDEKSTWDDAVNPSWHKLWEYRIKPSPAPVAVEPEWRALLPDEKAVAGEDECHDGDEYWHKVAPTGLAGYTPAQQPRWQFRTRRPLPSPIAVAAAMIANYAAGRPQSLTSPEPKPQIETTAMSQPSSSLPAIGSRWAINYYGDKTIIGRVIGAGDTGIMLRSRYGKKHLIASGSWNSSTKTQLSRELPASVSAPVVRMATPIRTRLRMIALGLSLGIAGCVYNPVLVTKVSTLVNSVAGFWM